MANKFLDQNGLLYFWQKIVNKFVAKVDGKGLSTNDFTDDLKAKLNGIEDGANKTKVEDTLTSTSTTNALSANQGKVLNEKIQELADGMDDLGYGDMLKSEYDIDNNGQVDKADDSDKLGGQSPEYYATSEEVGKKANDVDLAPIAKTGSYNDLIDKPTDFAPSTHGHEMTDINGLNDALDGKSDNGHKHTSSDITDFQNEMNKKANVSHTHQQSEVTGLEDVINDVTEIAQGKCRSYTYDTVDDMNTALTDTNFTATLKTGDVFLIRAVDVPDYWWDSETGKAQILETTKVNLETISNTEIDTIVAS